MSDDDKMEHPEWTAYLTRCAMIDEGTSSLVAMTRLANHKEACRIAGLEPIYDGGPDHLAALARERDEAFKSVIAALDENQEIMKVVARLDDEVATLTAERDACRSELLTAREIIDRDTAIIAAQVADIVLLRMALAKAEPVKLVPKPPNPFREFCHDPRRIGG